jgi:hypothetical protein
MNEAKRESMPLPSHDGTVPMTASSAADFTKAQPSRRSYLNYLTFMFCASLYLIPFMRVIRVGSDEGTFLCGAVRIVQGQVFARDFFEVMGPGTFYLLAMFFKLFGVTFFAARLSLFLTSLGTGLLIYFLSRRLGPRHRILPCLVLAATCFGGMWPGISHHVDSNFFALLSVALLVLWLEKGRGILLVAAGSFAAITTCIHQPKGMMLLLAMLVWLTVQNNSSRTKVFSLGLATAGYCTILAIVLVYFWGQSGLGQLIHANFVFPSSHYGGANEVPYAQDLRVGHWDLWVNTAKATGFGRWAAAIAIILVTPFLFIATLPALLLVVGSLYKWRRANPEVILYGLCGCSIWLSEFHRRDIDHIVFGSPLLVILCVHLLGSKRKKIVEIALDLLALAACCLAGVNFLIVMSMHPSVTRVGSVRLVRPDPVITFLDQHVPPGDDIFVYPYCPTYYFLSSTTNPTAYSFILYHYNTSEQFLDVTHALEQRRPRYVVWDTQFLANAEAGGVLGRQRVIPSELIVEPYLKSHYTTVSDEGGTLIMERNTGNDAR